MGQDSCSLGEILKLLPQGTTASFQFERSRTRSLHNHGVAADICEEAAGCAFYIILVQVGYLYTNSLTQSYRHSTPTTRTHSSRSLRRLVILSRRQRSISTCILSYVVYSCLLCLYLH